MFIHTLLSCIVTAAATFFTPVLYAKKTLGHTPNDLHVAPDAHLEPWILFESAQPSINNSTKIESNPLSINSSTIAILYDRKTGLAQCHISPSHESRDIENLPPCDLESRHLAHTVEKALPSKSDFGVAGMTQLALAPAAIAIPLAASCVAGASIYFVQISDPSKNKLESSEKKTKIFISSVIGASAGFWIDGMYFATTTLSSGPMITASAATGTVCYLITQRLAVAYFDFSPQ